MVEIDFEDKKAVEIDQGVLDSVVEDLLYVLPVIHKKLLKIPLSALPADVSRLHLAAMMQLEDGGLPICEVARRLGMLKSQMTGVINQLSALGMVTKRRDMRDRRVSRASLTDSGRETLKRFREMVRKNLKFKLSYLSADELAGLSVALRKLRHVSMQLEE